jgi:hypothetical protein
VRDELAGRVLDRLLDWTPAEQARWMEDLRRLAAYKYDQYEGFSPGERFFERLARLLREIESPEDRRRFVQFIRSQLLFISRHEMNHAIACVYPDYIRHDLVRRAAAEIGVSRFQVRAVTGSAAFRSLRRKTLFLGLSDGARLDRLRRASPELSHEQFWLSPELGPKAAATMREKLAEALQELGLDGPAQFRNVVLVDDFYGSGTSLLHRKEDGAWGGKLNRAREHLVELRGGDQPLLTDDAAVAVVLYVASQQARTHIEEVLSAFEASWTLHVVQPLPAEVVVNDPELRRICELFFDDVLIDKHKKRRVPLGYEDVALPLVLHHNTPNNSICPLWADSVGRGGDERHALFPRYERHHVDRP